MRGSVGRRRHTAAARAGSGMAESGFPKIKTGLTSPPVRWVKSCQRNFRRVAAGFWRQIRFRLGVQLSQFRNNVRDIGVQPVASNASARQGRALHHSNIHGSADWACRQPEEARATSTGQP